MAYEEAMKYGGRVMLGDRPINVRYPLPRPVNMLNYLLFQWGLHKDWAWDLLQGYTCDWPSQCITC